MRHEYKVLHGEIPEALDEEVNIYLNRGWDLWGNPFVSRIITVYQSEINNYCQVVVRMQTEDQGRETEAEGMRMAQEPAGYTVQVPVLEELETRPTEAMKEFKEKVLGPWVEKNIGKLCCCAEYIGDNPNCPVHEHYFYKGRPVSGLVT
jgi:hypothetical protein